MIEPIGITEGGDPALNTKWIRWVQENRAAVLITKNPGAVLRQIQRNQLEKKRIMIHCGITGWGSTAWEPKVPAKEDSLTAYREAIEILGVNRVVLRIDPIIGCAEGRARALEISQHKHPEGRMRISFMDMYPHVRKRLQEAGIDLHGPFHQDRSWRKSIWEEMGKPETCAEPDIPGTPCIGEEECNILGVVGASDRKKQRPLCGCLLNKKELLGERKQCSHGCLYCYWADKPAEKMLL